jgi:hypothetical protein
MRGVVEKRTGFFDFYAQSKLSFTLCSARLA